jgi:hypothetical protein
MCSFDFFLTDGREGGLSPPSAKQRHLPALDLLQLRRVLWKVELETSWVSTRESFNQIRQDLGHFCVGLALGIGVFFVVPQVHAQSLGSSWDK